MCAGEVGRNDERGGYWQLLMKPSIDRKKGRE